jgi:hypothetical protein
MEINLEKYKKEGFIHIPNGIDKELLEYTRDLSVKMKYKYLLSSGKLRDSGTGVFWSGFEMASKLDSRLYKSYTSDIMYKLSSILLETSEPYLFNDQVVVKLPGDGVSFEPHFDNQYGPDPESSSLGKYKTVNISWVLHDMPTESGPLICLNKETNKWEEIIAKSGDIIAIDGNTLHGSNKNESIYLRGLYACVYSTEAIGSYHNNKNYPYPHFKGFYNERFIK